MGKSKPAPPDCGGTTPPAAPATPPTGSDTGSAGGTPPAAPAAPAAPSCPEKTQEVNERITETITNGNPASWNGTYSWDSKYTLEIKNCTATVTVKIKVTGTITAEQKAAWKSAIETKWNNKVYFCCSGCNCPQGIPCVIKCEFVDSGEHYTVTAQTPGASEGGRAGLGGTTSMTGWGVNDTVDVTHEFGHMLGCPEEYFTTNGVDYTEGGTKPGARAADGGIMNNPANDPLPRNYDTIKSQVESALGGSCATRAVSK